MTLAYHSQENYSLKALYNNASMRVCHLFHPANILLIMETSIHLKIFIYHFQY